MKETFGPHLIIDGENCDIKALMNQRLVYEVLDKLPAIIGMTKIMPPQVVEWLDKWAKTPGYSGFVMLAESHISLHTFPDSNYIFIDIFSCRKFDIGKALDFLKERFKIKEMKVNLVKRGINFNKQVLAGN